MICNLYLSKVLESNYRILSTLTTEGLNTAICFMDIDITAKIVNTVAVNKGNQITLEINKEDWETISNHVYKQNSKTLHPVYIIANANGYNTIEEVKQGIEKHYQEFKNKFSDVEIYLELKSMKELVLNGEYLYPNIILPLIDIYYSCEDGVYYEETFNELDQGLGLKEIGKTYYVNTDLLPDDLQNDNELVEKAIEQWLDKHYVAIQPKLEWLL